MLQKFQKILIVLGAIFLALLIIAGLGFSYGYFKGKGLDKSSAAYANAAVPAIVANWDINQLLSRAHPALLEKVPKEQMEKIFITLRGLGKLKNFSGCTGEANEQYQIQHYVVLQDTMTSAFYLCNAEFENDSAVVRLALLDTPDKGWQISGLHIDSKFFDQTKNQDKNSR
ncbi:MAG: hypothetical protein KGI29_03075 [Pseudomonadota bacterium]|nr:hypothetical protein [Pseudomonadota bacterium]